MERTQQILKTMISSVLCVLLVVVPLCVQFTLISVFPDLESVSLILCVCGGIQTMISAYGGSLMGLFMTQRKLCVDWQLWWPSIYSFEYLISPGYMIYCFLPWELASAVYSWCASGPRINLILPWFVHLMIYLPLPCYFIFGAVGLALAKSTEEPKLVIEVGSDSESSFSV